MLAQRRSALLTYARFVKLEHTVFSLPLLYAGAVLAQRGLPPFRSMLLIALAGFGARVAALGLNRLIDREIDAENPRTRARELPSGAMSVAEGGGIVAAGLIAYVAAAWLIAPVLALLAPVPLAIFLVYPYLKRVTSWAHLGVGLGLAMAPLGGWLAITRSVNEPAPGLLLAAFTFFWVSGFDIIYATLDEEFDRRAGLHSLPSRLGRRGALRISAAFHAAAFAALTLLVATALHTPLAWMLLAVAGVLLFLEHRRADDVNLAFFKVNAALGFVVLGVVLAGLRPVW
jgi:4-hydroxybenzoate polyprenyltransferase